MNDDQRRQLRRRIQRATTWDNEAEAKPQNACAHIIAGLNIMRVLEDKPQHLMQNLLHYGPKAYAGKGWASALIWYHKKSIDNYKSITLFGLWAQEVDDTTVLQIGTKALPFNAAVYNAESYNQLIERDFTTYYGHNGNPPPDSVSYESVYDVTRRIAQRQEIADAVLRWLRAQRF